MDKNFGIEVSFEMEKFDEPISIKDYLTRERSVDKEHKNKIFETCFESDEMVEFYKTQEINDDLLCDLITAAPISLHQKMELLEPIKDHTEFKETYNETKLAIEALKLEEGEIAILYTYKYWDTINFRMLVDEAVFSSNDILSAYLEGAFNDPEEDKECWDVLKKRKLNDEGVYNLQYVYYFIDGKPVFFEKHKPSFFRNETPPHISNPFKKGDIVSLDCQPFAPPKYALLLEDGYNEEGYNKCSHSILITKPDGSWIINHMLDGVFSPIFPPLSQLYRLKKYDGDLGEDKEFLDKVSAFVKDGDNGRKLRQKIYETHKGKIHYPGLPKENVLQIIDEIKSEEKSDE